MASIDRRELGAIFLGGAAGGVLRLAVTQLFPSGPTSWPWAVFAINISGAFALGYLATRLQERLALSTYRRPFAGTGFCGAFTTFSTMQLELLNMIRHDHFGLAAGYAVASILLGYAAVSAATALVRRVRPVF